MKKNNYKQIYVLLFGVILVLAFLSVPLVRSQRNVSDVMRGSGKQIENITVVDLRGSWHEMGRQYGELARKQLQDVYDFCTAMIEAKEGNAYKAHSIIETQTEQMPYTIREFFRGVSETSGLAAEQLYTVNAVERIAGLPKCSMAAVWGDHAKGGMVVGRNYDYGQIFSRLRNDLVVTIFHPADGSLSTAIIGYAGEIYAVNGMNEAGLFLVLNNGKASAPISAPDKRITGTTMLLDILFKADSLELLDRYFNTMLCSSSYIINVLDGKSSRSYEWCPLGVKHGENYNPDEMLISTNHYTNPDWEVEKPTDENSFMSFTRRQNLIHLCEENKGAVDAEIMKQMITTSIEDGGAANELTVYHLVAVPAERMLWVKTADYEQWAEINLNEYWK